MLQALHVRELKKLKRLNERTTLSFFHFMQQKWVDKKTFAVLLLILV